ncbi:hypothetical protein CAMGR0001_0241 [Campylobacter gracilis RM3268]|uniref:Uncharacterized protein n=1 Tax=Campylobacter gracilis RM3268 TaxID=553220 RepID=C8PKL9_9BACT|nr:hypothetical protein CAMGR0001_0241 [Campylobacter gracilis RM3268]
MRLLLVLIRIRLRVNLKRARQNLISVDHARQSCANLSCMRSAAKF